MPILTTEQFAPVGETDNEGSAPQTYSPNVGILTTNKLSKKKKRRRKK
jgi:hypothetical protein